MSERRHRAPLAETRASLLESCIWLLIWTTLLALLAIPLASPQLPLPLYFIGFTPFFLIFGLSLWLLRKGLSRTAAWLVVLGTLALQGFTNVFNQGMEAQALASSLNCILIAGFAISRSAAILTTIVVSLNATTYLY